jgi:hypothetical protein
MNDPIDYFQSLYHQFNVRNIENIIGRLDPMVKWANGMEGGYVFGHDGVRNYWARQFTLVNPRVEPVSITAEGNKVRVMVHQVVHDPAGNLLVDQMVDHVFELEDNKIISFNIQTA